MLSACLLLFALSKINFSQFVLDTYDNIYIMYIFHLFLIKIIGNIKKYYIDNN